MDRPVVLAAELLQEPLGQGDDILRAAAQRRQGQGDYIDTVKQVLTELAAPYPLAQILVGSGDNAYIHMHLPVGAQRHDHPLLNEAQQRYLCLGRQLVYLVEKQGSPVGDFQLAFGALFGVGKGPLFIAEELRFDQVLGDSAAVDRHEAAGCAAAAAVDEPGDHLLAGTRFAGQQHRRVDIVQVVNGFIHPLQLRAVGVKQQFVPFFQLLLQEGILGFQFFM